MCYLKLTAQQVLDAYKALFNKSHVFNQPFYKKDGHSQQGCVVYSAGFQLRLLTCVMALGFTKHGLDVMVDYSGEDLTKLSLGSI